MINAAAAPWTARAAISAPAPGTSAHDSDASAKPTHPDRGTRACAREM